MPTTSDVFNSINFRVLIASTGQSRQGSVSVRHVPWANESIIQLGGRQVTTARLRCYLASDTVFTNLKQAVGSQATLTYNGFSGTATMTGITEDQWIKNQQRIVTMTFELDSD